MANRTIEAILRLSSRLGSMRAFRDLSGHLGVVDRKAQAFNRRQMMIVNGQKAMYAAMLRYAAPVALAATTVASARDFATIERRMSRIGITAEASIAETDAALDRVRQIADDLRVPIDHVVDGLDSLTASGKTMKEALDLLPSVSAAAQAADADFSDMATSADAISASFEISADRMGRAFDIIAKGGKEGKFELKDMAAELPSLAPAFTALGYEGEKGLARLVAMLQTVRLETGTSGEAATSFMDVLTKMEGQTVTNNFKKFGVSLRKELAAARNSGEDILDAFVRLSNLAIKGDMSKLPQLFTDKQMLIGMRAIMRNTEALKEYQAAMSNAAGTVAADLDRIASDSQSKLDRIGNSWKRLKQNFGEGLFDAGLGTALDAVGNDLDRGAAIRKELDRRGMGYWQRENFLFTKSFTESGRREIADAAWRGGYRTEEDKRALADYGAYGKSRAAAPVDPLPPVSEKDRFGLPIAGPIPRFRDGGGAPVPEAQKPIPVPMPRPSDAERSRDAFDREFARYQVAASKRSSPMAAPDAAPGSSGRNPPPVNSVGPSTVSYKQPDRTAPPRSHRAAERASVAALRSDPNGLADAIDAALAEGGERAGRSIEEAARRINTEAATAGSTFERLLEGMGKRLGAEMAESFKANIGSINVNARVSGATVNSGRTMSAAGGVGPQ